MEDKDITLMSVRTRQIAVNNISRVLQGDRGSGLTRSLNRGKHQNSRSRGGLVEALAGERGYAQKRDPRARRSMRQLLEKLNKRSAGIALLGLGYVGLELALSFAREKFKVVGVDVDERAMRKARDRFRGTEIALTVDGVFATETSDFVIVAVQTPLDKRNSIDLEYVKAAAETISRGLSAGKCIVLESTSFPGTTEEVFKPILERSGYTAGRDFYLGYSPERLNPGDEIWNMKNTTKIVSGIDSESCEVCYELFSTIVDQVVKAPDIKTAEAAKAIENTFRFVNIALVNELSQVLSLMGIDTFEALKLASTKPFAFLPHYPSAGVGGPCIPVTPRYLIHRAKRLGHSIDLVELAGEINDSMIRYTVDLVDFALSTNKTSTEGSNITILGMSYKRGTQDIRNSPSLLVYTELKRLGAKIKYYDPYVRRVDEIGALSERSLEQAVKDADLVLILTDHDAFRKESLIRLVSQLSRRKTIVDSKGCLNPTSCRKHSLRYFGIGRPTPEGYAIYGKRKGEDALKGTIPENRVSV